MSRFVQVFFIRHTQSTDNAAQLYSGSARNPLLTPTGIGQAGELGRELYRSTILHVYSSDMLRALQVATVIAARQDFDCRLTTDPRLREVNLGLMTGMSKEQARVQFPGDRFRTENEFDFSDICGEDANQVIARHHKVLREIILQHGVDNHEAVRGSVAIVGHGTALRTTLRSLGDNTPFHTQGGYRYLIVKDTDLRPE